MLESRPVHGTGERRTGWFLDCYNQWPAIFRPKTHNWQDWTLTLFKLTGENSPYKRSWEIELWLLGFIFAVTYVLRDTDVDDPWEEPLSDTERNLCNKQEQR